MKIVEKMARAHANYVHGGSYDYDADYSQDEKDDHCDGMIAAITVTGLTEAQLEGLANGTMVCVPVEPTEAMKRAFQWGSVLPGEMGAGTNAEVYRAMLAAKEG